MKQSILRKLLARNLANYIVRRRISGSNSNETLGELYLKTRQLCDSKKLPEDVDSKGVFACNQLDLSDIKVYGFDYDYTLACYKPAMGYIIYNLGRDNLINKHKYPSEIRQLEYDPTFAIRGLHYDIQNGLLMKLDSFLQIELGTVYRGLTPVAEKEVFKFYKNRKVPIGQVTSDGKTSQLKSAKMVQLADLFSVPEINLLCNIADYFERNGIQYHPEILFKDVKESIAQGHPVMHQMAMDDANTFLEENRELRIFLDRLVKNKKKLFLITNSPFYFVNKGMSLIVGEDWEHFFDVIIVNARKPLFFTEESCPMRRYDKFTNTNLWDRVTSLQKGHIYYEGTVHNLLEMTGWRGGEVLYFGDHPYFDLADVTLEYGWRTGAIISELTHEIDTLNNDSFKRNVNWLQMLTQLMEITQVSEDPDALQYMHQWQMEIHRLRMNAKSVFNKQFGSVFRTHHNPTYFSRRLFRFSDIYTSSIANLLNYSANHKFFPRRGVMPHEYTSHFV